MQYVNSHLRLHIFQNKNLQSIQHIKKNRKQRCLILLKNEVKKDEDGSSHVEVRSYLADFLENDGDAEENDNNWRNEIV